MASLGNASLILTADSKVLNRELDKADTRIKSTTDKAVAQSNKAGKAVGGISGSFSGMFSKMGGITAIIGGITASIAALRTTTRTANISKQISDWAGSFKAVKPSQVQVVQLKGVTDNLSGSVGAATKKVAGFGSSISGVAGKLGAFATGVTGVTLTFTALIAAAAKTAMEITKISRLARTIGFKSMEQEFEGLIYVMGQAGIGADQVVDIMKDMQKNLGNVFNELDAGMTSTLRSIGLNIDNLHNQDRQQQFYSILEALRGVQNQAERTAIAQRIFGEAAFRMGDVLDKSTDEIRALQAEYNNLAGVLNEPQRRLVEQMHRDMGKAWAATQGLLRKMAVEFAPLVSALSDVVIQAADDLKPIVRDLASIAKFLTDSAKAISDAVDSLNGVNTNNGRTNYAIQPGLARTIANVPTGGIGLPAIEWLATRMGFQFPGNSPITRPTNTQAGANVAPALESSVRDFSALVRNLREDLLNRINTSGDSDEIAELRARIQRVRANEQAGVQARVNLWQGLPLFGGPVANFVQNLNNNISKASDELQKLLDNLIRRQNYTMDNNLINNLQQEYDRLTLSNEQWQIRDMLMRGSDRRQIATVRSLQSQIGMMRKFQDAQQQAQQITDQFKTPAERMEEEQSRLRMLYANQLLDAQTFARAMAETMGSNLQVRAPTAAIEGSLEAVSAVVQHQVNGQVNRDNDLASILRREEGLSRNRNATLAQMVQLMQRINQRKVGVI